MISADYSTAGRWADSLRHTGPGRTGLNMLQEDSNSNRRLLILHFYFYFLVGFCHFLFTLSQKQFSPQLCAALPSRSPCNKCLTIESHLGNPSCLPSDISDRVLPSAIRLHNSPRRFKFQITQLPLWQLLSSFIFPYFVQTSL